MTDQLEEIKSLEINDSSNDAFMERMTEWEKIDNLVAEYQK